MADDATLSVHDVADRVKAAGGQAADYVRHQYDDLSGRAHDTNREPETPFTTVKKQRLGTSSNVLSRQFLSPSVWDC